MKLQTSSRELSRTLSIASKAILAKNSLSILDSVLMRCQDGKFTLTGGSDQSTVIVPVEVSILEGKAQDFQPIAIRANLILPVITTLPETPLTITVDYESDGRGFMSIERIGGNMRIPFQNGSEYPLTATIDTPQIQLLNMPAQRVLSYITTARPFCATDELRMVMNGVYIDADAEKGEVRFVASDGHKMYRYIMPNKNTDGTPSYDYQSSEMKVGKILASQFIAPLPLAFSKCETIDFLADDKQIIFRSGDTQCIIRCIEGNYPNYNSVIPANNEHTLIVNKKELTAAIKRVMIFASDATQMVKLSKNGMFVNLTAEDIDFATSAHEDVTAIDCTLPDRYAIGFKSTALLECLSCVEGDEVLIQLSSPDRPMLIKENDPNSPLTCLVMPMLIQD